MTKLGKGSAKQTPRKKNKNLVTGRAKVLPEERKFLQSARPHLRRFNLQIALVQLISMLRTLPASKCKHEQDVLVTDDSQIRQEYQKSTPDIDRLEEAIAQCSRLYHTIVEQPEPSSFVPYTSEHDLLFFYAKVRQHLGAQSLGWRQCQYVFFRWLMVSNLLYRSVFEMADGLNSMLDLCMRDEVVSFRFDYQKARQWRHEVQGELIQVMFHLVIETLALAEIDIRPDQ